MFRKSKEQKKKEEATYKKKKKKKKKTNKQTNKQRATYWIRACANAHGHFRHLSIKLFILEKNFFGQLKDKTSRPHHHFLLFPSQPKTL